MTKLKKITRIIGAVSEPALKGVAGPLAPIWDTVKAFNDAAIDQISQNKKIRLDRFHKALIKGVPQNKAALLLHSGDTDYGSYESLLNACWQDIEEGKTELYARLASKILSDELDPKLRINFIMFLRELLDDECVFFKELYIRGKHRFAPNSTTAGQIKEFVSTKSSITKLTIKKLEGFYFFDSDEGAVTNFGEQFLTSIFSPNELSPESIGKSHYKGHKAVIYCDFGSAVAAEYSKRLSDHLFKNNFSCGVLNILEGNFSNIFVFHAVILIVTNDTKKKCLETFCNHKRKSKMPYVQVSVLGEEVAAREIPFEFDEVFNVKSVDDLKECFDFSSL